MSAHEVAQSVPVSPPKDDMETRILRYGDPALIVVGSAAHGFSLHRRLGERAITLSGDSIQKAFGNAAMGMLSVKDEDELFKYRRDPFATREPKAGRVYFIGGDTGCVKIGFAVNPELRRRDLQCGSPIPLRILAVVDGMPADEREYHKRFAVHRLHGEWFERCPEIEAEIERLNASRKEGP